MLPEPVRLFHPTGPDRVAVVSAEPVYGSPDQVMLRVARGARAAKLDGGKVYGPTPLDAAAGQIAQLVEELLAAGFVISGRLDLLQALDDARPQVRARAALRLGWLRVTEATPKLLSMLDSSVDDLCSIIDALGALGDPRAAEPLRKLAARKLLSRRRSAVEALRSIGDSLGLAEAHQRALEQLPAELAAAVESSGVSLSGVEAVLAALEQVESKRLGLCLDLLYELATAPCVEAVRRRLSDLHLPQPFVWRYVKSIWKRAMLRHDWRMLAEVTRLVERQGRTAPQLTVTVKSGYDGQSRKTPLFSRRTRHFVRRAAWRYLRGLAAHRPEWYSRAAAAAVCAYQQADALPPQGLYGQFADCYLLQRVLYGNSSRLALNDSRLAFRFRSSKHVAAPASSVREEAYPDRWDQSPEGYLWLLAGASLDFAHQFAWAAIEARHPRLLESASAEQLLQMVSAAVTKTAERGMAELQRRFDPRNPDLELLQRVVRDGRDAVQAVARAWLEASVAWWAERPAGALPFLLADNGETQACAAELLIGRLARADESLRRSWAEQIVAELRSPSTEELGGVESVARQAVLRELSSLVSLEELTAWLAGSIPAVQTVAADLLAVSSEAAAQLGVAGIARLAVHELAAVRAAAARMLAPLHLELQRDPAVLFELLDCRWEDTRATAMRLLNEARDWSQASLDQWTALFDSPRLDVQAFALELLRQHAESLDAASLIGRLAEHPQPKVRSFALEQIEGRLPPGGESLERVLPCLRAALFDPWPSRADKRRAIDVLFARGQLDERQAAAAAALLDELLASAGTEDFQRALVAAATLRLQWPELAGRVRIRRELDAAS